MLYQRAESTPLRPCILGQSQIGTPPTILLRESFREGGKVRKRTLCNLSGRSLDHIEGLRGVLKGGTVIPAGRDGITRTLPHGHVAAALGTARALVTAASSLAEALDLGEVDEDELHAALDWLLVRQPAVETTLAKRHLKNGALVLYDVSSSDMEGRCCPLARRGHSCDGKPGTLQIVYGLLCAPDGCPVAIEVFDDNTGDPSTLATQLKQRFQLEQVVLVSDRGMITQARINEDITPKNGI